MLLPEDTGLCYPAYSTYLCLFVRLCWRSDQLSRGVFEIHMPQR